MKSELVFLFLKLQLFSLSLFVAVGDDNSSFFFQWSNGENTINLISSILLKVRDRKRWRGSSLSLLLNLPVSLGQTTEPLFVSFPPPKPGMVVFLFVTFWVYSWEEGSNGGGLTVPEKKMNWEDPIVAFWEWKCTEGLHELLSTICVWLLWRLVLFSCGNKLSLDTRFGTVNVWAHCLCHQWVPNLTVPKNVLWCNFQCWGLSYCLRFFAYVLSHCVSSSSVLRKYIGVKKPLGCEGAVWYQA